MAFKSIIQMEARLDANHWIYLEVDPADWFDIGESTKALLKGAPGAIL